MQRLGAVVTSADGDSPRVEHRGDVVGMHTVELEREQGKFATRDEMAEAIIEWLENADEGSIYGIGADGDSTYNTTMWEVEQA